MYQQVFDREYVELAYETARDNLPQIVNCRPENFFVYTISEGVLLCSIFDGQYRNIVLRLDQFNPLKNTLITSPKAVEIIAAYEFHQNNIGPKLLSVFKNGRIEEWIDGQLLGNQFHDNEEMKKLVAKCIAKINLIDEVKCEKNNNFLCSKVKVFFNLIFKAKSDQNRVNIFDLIDSSLSRNRLVDKSSSAIDLKHNTRLGELENEFEFLTKSFENLNCSNQLVFSHNDLNQENIYRRLDQTNPHQIYVLNYDLCGYNYRGYDLAHYLNNIAFDFTNPPTNLSQLKLINDEELKNFLHEYLLEFYKGETTDLNKLYLIKEVKFFKIYSAFLSILVSILTTLSTEPNESMNLEFLKLRIEFYLKLKNDFLIIYPESIAK